MVRKLGRLFKIKDVYNYIVYNHRYISDEWQWGVCVTVCSTGKVLSPVNVSEREVDGGGRRLSWNSPYSPSSRLTSGLTYQVKYRRHGHDWTVSTRVYTSVSFSDRTHSNPHYPQVFVLSCLHNSSENSLYPICVFPPMTIYTRALKWIGE